MESQRRSGIESWDREHVWTIWISKGLKIVFKHNKQKGNMIGIQFLSIFENKIITETKVFCQLCNLTHTVEHSGRILGCVDNYQIKKATTIETWHQEAMALLPTWWRLALEKKRCHFSCCQHLLGTQLWQALLLYRIHKGARKRFESSFDFFWILWYLFKPF